MSDDIRPPEGLDVESAAGEVWLELLQHHGRRLARLEPAVLRVYCFTVADHRRARAVIDGGGDDSGIMLRAPDGSIELSPWARRESDLAARIARLADQLGLAPRGREGIPAPARRSAR